MTRSSILSQVQELQAQGLSRTQACRDLGVAESTVRGWLKHEPAFPVSGDPTPGFTEIPVLRADFSDRDHLVVYPIGDFHVGSPACDLPRLKEWIDYIAGRDDAAVILTGDLLNCALKDSKSESYDESLPLGAAKEALTDLLKPIRKKVICAIPGNHEARVYRAVGACPVKDVCYPFDIPYYQDAVLIAVNVGEVEYDIYLRHGNGGGGIGARANRLQKGSQVVWGDIFISGHVHNQAAFIEDLFRRDGDRMVRHRKLYVASGSFLRYEGYAAVAGYSPGKLGAPRIRLDGTRKDAHVSL